MSNNAVSVVVNDVVDLAPPAPPAPRLAEGVVDDVTEKVSLPILWQSFSYADPPKRLSNSLRGVRAKHNVTIQNAGTLLDDGIESFVSPPLCKGYSSPQVGRLVWNV